MPAGGSSEAAAVNNSYIMLYISSCILDQDWSGYCSWNKGMKSTDSMCFNGESSL